MPHANDARHEKTLVALTSVGATIGLIVLKLIVALLTGSLGILAEATQSGLDLVASLMTFFAVRVADKPADATHNYGHSKVENVTALLEAVLLLLTALWVIYEGIRRLLFADHGRVDASIWAFAVLLISIGVDLYRSRALLRVARRLGSQALEADALNFKTDIWSASVVFIGLLIVRLSQSFPLPAWLGLADAIAALGVSGIVIWAALRLAKETIDALIDRTPQEFAAQVQTYIDKVEGVTEVRRIRLRRTGNKFFADVIIAAPRTFTFEQIHEVSERVEKAAMDGVRSVSPQGEVDIVVHVEPTATAKETVTDQIHYLAELQGVHAHDIHVREVGGRLEADFDVEVQSDMKLSDAHAVASRLEQAVLQSNGKLRRVTTHLEAPNDVVVPRQDVTNQYAEMRSTIRRIADEIAGTGSAHDVHLYRSRSLAVESNGKNGNQNGTEASLDLVLHTTFDPQVPLSQAHIQAEEIKRSLRRTYPNLDSVVIHTEPPEQ